MKGLMAQDYLHKLDTQHFADMGLINERINSKRVEFSTLFEQGKYSSDSMWIATSISYYDSALSLGSADDLYYQNLGWLYLFKNKLPISSLYFHRSIAADCNNMEAFIGLGFLSEIHSDTLSASINYEKALLTNLDLISSPFCRDLKKRQPVLYENLLRNCIRDLNARLLIDTNPVDLGRLGAAYYHLGQWSDSETILRKVVKILPNLNRPWYYLGLLQREKSINEAEALPFFQKAELLDPRDYLVDFELGRSYQRLSKERLAITYYKRAIKNYVEHRGRHFTKGLDMYNVLPFHDELIPFGLNEYTSPYLDIYKLSGVIADLSLAVGNHGDYEIFNKIMMKKARPTGEQIKAWNLL